MTMDKICAVIDIQGFQLPDRFIPKEVAFVSENYSQCFEINPGISFKDLSDKDKQIVIHTTRYKNGLHILPFNDRNFCYLPKEEDLGNILLTLYNFVASEEKPLVAVKNQQTLKYLSDSGIPFIDLNEEKWEFPNHKAIQEKYNDNYLCSYHKKPFNQNIILTCAYRKCAQIFREINEKIMFAKSDW